MRAIPRLDPAEAPSGAVLNGTSYSTISAAIAAASAGDLIDVYPGTYAEDIAFTGKTGLRIEGQGGAQGVKSTGYGKTLLLVRVH